jgi:hypothetical protein
MEEKSNAILRGLKKGGENLGLDLLPPLLPS